MKAIIVAHNQMEMVQSGIKVLRLFAGMTAEDIIIVDNGSEDGLRAWLETYSDWNYLIFDEGEQNYGVAVNAAIREFGIQEDILLLSPEYFVLPGMVEALSEALQEAEDVGAAFPVFPKTDAGKERDYLTAVTYAQNEYGKKKRSRSMLGPTVDAVLIKEKMLRELGEFEERLKQDAACSMDFVLQGILKGYRCIECGNAYVYFAGMRDFTDRWNMWEDRSVLKEKWNMNYFNIIPNKNLLELIDEEEQKEFSVLEIGCDMGANLLEIKNRYPNASVYGVEYVPEAAALAKAVIPAWVADIEKYDLDLGDLKFDYIICGDVLEHLRDPQGTVHYCRSLLKDGGKIVASIPNLMHYSVVRDLLRGNFTYRDMGLLDRTHIHFFTYKEIVRMFKRENYEIVGLRSMYEKATQEDMDFVKQLMPLTEGVDEDMFYAFQYQLVAQKM